MMRDLMYKQRDVCFMPFVLGETGMKWLFLGVALIASGCAAQSGNLSARDVVALQGRIDDLEAQSIRQKTKVAALEKQVTQLEDRVSMLTRRTSIDAREVVKIEPDNGVSSHFERVVPDDDDVYQEIIISEEKKRSYFGNSRSRTSGAGASGKMQPYENVVTNDRLPSKTSGAGAAGAAGSSAGAVAAGSSAGAAGAVQSPMLFYQEGIDLYRQGNYDEAQAKFEKFLAAHPDESYIDNALYWIGECYYGKGLYHEAAGYFHKIVQEYPNANKVPDALLKVSLTYQRLGKTDSARDMLRYLMNAYPGTEAARIGKEKYEAMRLANP